MIKKIKIYNEFIEFDIDLVNKFYPLWQRFNTNCYGSGEEAILKTLKEAFKSFKCGNREEDYTYDSRDIIKQLNNESLAWCIITLLEHAQFLEWGTSIRMGWTTDKGFQFVKLILENEIKDLYNIAMLDEDELEELNTK